MSAMLTGAMNRHAVPSLIDAVLTREDDSRAVRFTINKLGLFIFSGWVVSLHWIVAQRQSKFLSGNIYPLALGNWVFAHAEKSKLKSSNTGLLKYHYLLTLKVPF